MQSAGMAVDFLPPPGLRILAMADENDTEPLAVIS